MNNAQTIRDIPEIPTGHDDLFKLLEELGLNFTLYEHDAVFSVAESQHLKENIPGLHCRNLFLKDKKGAMFLIVAANETELDLKKLQVPLDCGRLSFGSAERLMEYLGIYPGAVCPFAVINDETRVVHVILDQKIAEAEAVCVHPLNNAMTVGISPGDLMKFFDHTGHHAQILDMSDLAPDL